MRCLADECIAEFYLTPMRPSIKSTYGILVDTVEKANAQRPPYARQSAPSIAYLRRRIRSLDRHDVIIAREGPNAVKHRWRREVRIRNEVKG
jgi:hypothetical protein